MGCPDAVCSQLKALKGIDKVAYDAEKDLFTVSFDPSHVSLETIFAAVYTAGKQMGKDYFPEVIT